MIELFDVPPAEDARFLAAWAAEAPAGARLYQALRDDTRPRFASVSPEPGGGVLLIAELDDERAWARALEAFATRQGFIGAHRDGRFAVIQWSSPLMYARAVREHGELIPRAALYRPAP